jgi:hypothetical protein
MAVCQISIRSFAALKQNRQQIERTECPMKVSQVSGVGPFVDSNELLTWNSVGNDQCCHGESHCSSFVSGGHFSVFLCRRQQHPDQGKQLTSPLI